MLKVVESLVKGEGWSQGFEEPPQRFAGEEGQGGRGHAAENEGGQGRRHA